MLESIPFLILVGTVLGFLSGLGIGGGSLLILWLTGIMGIEPSAARGINLLFFIPAALASSIVRLRKGKLAVRPLIPGILAGCFAAALFSWLSVSMDTALLKKLFGVVLIITGIRELFYRPRNAR